MRRDKLKRVSSELLVGLCDFAEDFSGTPKTKAMLSDALEHMIKVEASISELLAYIPSLDSKLDSVSRRVFLRDDCSCVVCGFRDNTAKEIGKHRLCVNAKTEDQFVTLCKRCGKLFAKESPWRNRDEDGENAATTLQELAERFQQSEDKE